MANSLTPATLAEGRRLLEEGTAAYYRSGHYFRNHAPALLAAAERLLGFRTCDGCGHVYDRANGAPCGCALRRASQAGAERAAALEEALEIAEAQWEAEADRNDGQPEGRGEFACENIIHQIKGKLKELASWIA